MTIWDIMRTAAVMRHRWINLVFEGSCPTQWAQHMRVIRAVYGY
jgi:hypothetical protein